MKTISKTFCILPWMHISTSATGCLRVCCNSSSPKNLILKSKGEPYKIHEKGRLKSAWHSPVYKKVRQQMLNGLKPGMCSPCFREESAGLESARIRFNRKYMFGYEPSESLPLHIKYLDLRLGNKCNLKCRMCNPFSSSSLFREWNQLSKQPVSKFISRMSESDKRRVKKITWPEKIDFTIFREFLSYIEEIYLTGGEPLLIKEHYDLLEFIVQEGFAPSIELRYNTNITKYDEKIVQFWKKFKCVRINASIDAFGALNNYIRYPSKWNLIENNLSQLISLTNQFPNIIVEVDCTVQMYNITSMKEYLLWIKKQNCDLFFNILDNPKFLNIRVLPEKLKKKAKEDLLLFQDIFPVKKIVDYMEKESWTSYIGDFFRYTDFFDSSRNQKMSHILPELSSYRNI